MARRFRSRGARRSGSALLWGGAQFTVAGVALGGLSAGWALSPLDVMNFDDPTVMRSQLIPSFRIASLQGGNGGTVSIGVIVASGDTDSAAVPTIFPDPATDPEADWIIRVTYAVAAGTPANSFFNASLDWLHQTKTKRKIGRSEGLLIVAENNLATGTIDCAADFRYLVKVS